jgi:hypothetical protein
LLATNATIALYTRPKIEQKESMLVVDVESYEGVELCLSYLSWKKYRIAWDIYMGW